MEENYIIGLHFGGQKDENKNNYLYNAATFFKYILIDIKDHINEIHCIYIADKYNEEINLLYDYNEELLDLFEKQDLYLKQKKNIKFLKENTEIYINDKKIDFVYRYKMKEFKKINVKFKFKKKIENTSFMFHHCSHLKSIDLSLFNTSNVQNMSHMFSKCEILNSIDLFSFDTSNVNNMNNMFDQCSSLKNLNLSSFNTSKVKEMSYMFNGCSSLKSIDLSSFDTSNVNNMNRMFYKCSSLEEIDLSSFKTYNTNFMREMFRFCSSLKSIDLSSFDITYVIDLQYMFADCSSLKSINISSFYIEGIESQVTNIFKNCSSLTKDNIEINEYLPIFTELKFNEYENKDQKSLIKKSNSIIHKNDIDTDKDERFQVNASTLAEKTKKKLETFDEFYKKKLRLKLDSFIQNDNYKHYYY